MRPYPDKSGLITFAKGYYDSKKGRITAEWKVENGETTYSVRAPKEIDLCVDAPENVVVNVERF